MKDGDLVETELIDTPPVSVRQVSPQATRLAIQSHISGTVLLRVLVDENGEPVRVEILRDTSPKVGLGETSRSALEQWRWKPATEGRPQGQDLDRRSGAVQELRETS